MLENDANTTKSKLNILFLLDTIAAPILELTIAEAMIENELMDYFTFKTFLNELEEDGFIRCFEIVDKNHYEILERGKETLQYFGDLILGNEKEALLKYIDNNINDIYKSKEMMLDYKKMGNSKYQIDISLVEGGSPYFNLTVEVPSKESVDKILDNWTSNSSDMYVEIMNLLLKKRGNKND